MPPNTTPDLDPPPITSTDADQDIRVVKWRMSYSMRRRALKRTSDFGLGAAGAGMALASATFAFVMMKADIADPSFGGAEYLLLFTRPLQSPATPNRQMATRSLDPNIDYSATGTIGPRSKPADAIAEPSLQMANQPRATPQEPRVTLKDYALRSVRGGVATTSGPTGTFVVESGSLMPNGDLVVSIDRRGGRWVVVTSNGIIEDQ
jgi:hypothetical protein